MNDFNPTQKNHKAAVGVPTAPPRPKVMKCPYCDAQPCALGAMITSFDAHSHAIVFICDACEKILSIAPILPSVPQPSRDSSRSLIEVFG